MTDQKKWVLVTGATGRQGGAVARHLLKNGWKVKALTRNPDQPQAKALRELGADILKGNLSGIAHKVE
ncbi:MAG: NmrA family NAD(P)-binding protein [Balneolaceae bacterium]|nr:NmrA family NAD(P)-binding protein [Balneolaceae bacterium]MCH8549679.1 NmrA family NAD(P)-binding protein [Balneolaceae bacterium]